MERPYPYMAPCGVFMLVLVLLTITSSSLFAQTPAADSSNKQNKIADTAAKAAKQYLLFQRQQVTDNLKSKLAALKNLAVKRSVQKKDTVKVDIAHPFSNLFHTKPLFGFKGGYAAYYFNFRSAADTPYVEKNVFQHNLTGRINFLIAGQLPVQVNYWLRQTNSTLFRNIADVQVSFNGAEYKRQLQSSLQQRLMGLSGNLKDSLNEKLHGLKSLQLTDLKNTLLRSFNPQKLAEAYETLNVPGVTYKPHLPDSINRKREDSLRQLATTLLQTYARVKGEYDQVAGQVDSLQSLLRKNRDRIKQYEQMLAGLNNTPVSAQQLRRQLDKYGLPEVQLPARYKWLMGLRNFSLGRSTANYSELTAKNISVNGISIGYNSWYYLAITAGTVNYRFRDFVVSGFNKKPQTLLMLRAGIGRLEKNYFIISAYRGQKQLTVSRMAANTITITGISAETRWQLNRNSWVTAEAAKSMAPDFRHNPEEKRTTFNLSDKTNQAVAFRLYSYIPATASRIEVFYKQAGANFQSFANFQTNAALQSWYIKGEQNFFKRRLRVTASVRKNEFTNPFIVQAYKSDAVFKSINASLRLRKWPIITAGYQPMSQITRMDNLVVENRFQSLVATLYHQYKLNRLQTATTIMVNKFYNSSADTGFLYYNASHLYWVQQFYFSHFTATVGASRTKNSAYELNVLDAGFQPHFSEKGTVGLGCKINSLNNNIIKVGGYLNANIRLFKKDMLYLTYEHGYLPGFKTGLVSNEMATVQFVKTFR